MKKHFFVVPALAFHLLGMPDAEAQHAVRYCIETSRPQQIMEHFGASDAWGMQYIGLWPQEKREQVADWLFSTDYDSDGNPEGIGLSIWRFNIGAGSAEQGEASQIGSPWTRTDCFLQADGTYDWNRQEGQRNFLRLAKERGVGHFLAFLNSSPVYYTQNGLATNTGRGGTLNLKPDCYAKLTDFVATVLDEMEEREGIHFDYLSLFNEPDGTWNWTGPKQEGSPATNSEVAGIVRLMSRELVNRGSSTQILVNEASDYRCMFSYEKTDRYRGNQIQSFFSPDSTATYLGNLPNVRRLMTGHSYWTNTPLQRLRDCRCQLRDTLQKYEVGFWQSEVCIMKNDTEIGGGQGFDRSMKTALYVARVIHHDIVYAGASSWQWWRAVATGDYKDGLIRAYPDETLLDGQVEDSKLLWALGNYSRFVRPGAVRLSVSAYDKSDRMIPEGDTEQTGLMCTAYKNVDGSMAVVVINYGNEDRTVTLDEDVPAAHRWQQYRTSDREGENLKPVGAVNDKVTVPAHSIVTLVSMDCVEPVVKWENAVGQLTDSHWGVNDIGKALDAKNEKMSAFLGRLEPGVIRLHHYGLVQSWVDNKTQSWKKDVIRQELAENAGYAFRHGKRLMLTLDDCPEFIGRLPLTEAQEDSLAAFFAQLPGIIEEAGYKGEVMYEFLNEKEKPYKEDCPAYWRLLNKIAKAIKTADPAAKCGGPAVSWPWQEVYKGFIDNCAQNMDFISFHLYARGPGEYPADDLFSGKHGYRGQAEAAAAVVKYLEAKDIDHLEVYLDEFNVQYVWKPYEPAHHNHVGAAWMACFVKNVALGGVTGLNVWNTEDGAYGMNYVSAPARLYELSNPYLRGTVVEGYDKEDRVEVLPVLSENGGRSILFVNRTGECLNIEDAAQLLNCSDRKMKAFRIDGTTRVKDKVYDIGIIENKQDIILHPYGLVLVTDMVR